MPVWPICFCSIWPIGAAPPMRLPAARMPMSRIVMPPSDNAPMTASDARSTVSFSGCLPNLVMWIPRIQMSSAIIPPLGLSGRAGRAPVDDRGPGASDCSSPSRVGSFRRCETESDRLGAGAVDADHLGRELHLHADVHVLRVGGG